MPLPIPQLTVGVPIKVIDGLTDTTGDSGAWACPNKPFNIAFQINLSDIPISILVSLFFSLDGINWTNYLDVDAAGMGGASSTVTQFNSLSLLFFKATVANNTDPVTVDLIVYCATNP